MSKTYIRCHLANNLQKLPNVITMASFFVNKTELVGNGNFGSKFAQFAKVLHPFVYIENSYKKTTEIIAINENLCHTFYNFTQNKHICT